MARAASRPIGSLAPTARTDPCGDRQAPSGLRRSPRASPSRFSREIRASGSLFFEQAQRTGELGRLPALLHIELRKDVLKMRLYGLGRNIERTGDLLIRLIESHERQHATLALGQRIQGVATGFRGGLPVGREQTLHARDQGRISLIADEKARKHHPHIFAEIEDAAARPAALRIDQRRDSRGLAVVAQAPWSAGSDASDLASPTSAATRRESWFLHRRT